MNEEQKEKLIKRLKKIQKNISKLTIRMNKSHKDILVKNDLNDLNKYNKGIDKLIVNINKSKPDESKVNSDNIARCYKTLIDLYLLQLNYNKLRKLGQIQKIDFLERKVNKK
jgi:soluble cytochrome b562